MGKSDSGIISVRNLIPWLHKYQVNRDTISYKSISDNKHIIHAFLVYRFFTIEKKILIKTIYSTRWGISIVDGKDSVLVVNLLYTIGACAAYPEPLIDTVAMELVIT
jgi:hypothetical protein